MSFVRALSSLAALVLLLAGAGGTPATAANAVPAPGPDVEGSPKALPRLGSFELADQFGTVHRVAFPREKPLLLLVGDRRGSEEVDAWIDPLKARWGSGAEIAGIADVSGAPRFLRSRIQEGIRKQRPRPLMLDFEGRVTDPLHCMPKTANLLVVDARGRTLLHLTGKPDEAKLERIGTALAAAGVAPASR